jgi:hypothetical protein
VNLKQLEQVITKTRKTVRQVRQIKDNKIVIFRGAKWKSNSLADKR